MNIDPDHFLNFLFSKMKKFKQMSYKGLAAWVVGGPLKLLRNGFGVRVELGDLH